MGTKYMRVDDTNDSTLGRSNRMNWNTLPSSSLDSLEDQRVEPTSDDIQEYGYPVGMKSIMDYTDVPICILDSFKWLDYSFLVDFIEYQTFVYHKILGR